VAKRVKRKKELSDRSARGLRERRSSALLALPPRLPHMRLRKEVKRRLLTLVVPGLAVFLCSLCIVILPLGRLGQQ
jgi:hypothetical protein